MAYVPTNIIIPRWSEIDYAFPGKAFADATYGGSFNIRKAGKLAINSRVRKDVRQTDYTDMYDAVVDLELYASDIQTLYNMYLLGAVGPHNIRFKGADGKWFNFVDNGVNGNGNLVTAGGSVLLNHTFTFEVGGTDRAIKTKMMGGMYAAEYSYLLANSASGATGGSSGSAVTGATHMAYNNALYSVPGITSITVDGYDLGSLEEAAKITLDFKEMGSTLTRKQPILAWVDIKAEIPMWQTAMATELTDAKAWANTDHTVNFTLADGMVISCVNSVIPSLKFNNDEAKRTQTIVFEGQIPNDNPPWAGTNVAFNVGANTLTLNRIGYV